MVPSGFVSWACATLQTQLHMLLMRHAGKIGFVLGCQNRRTGLCAVSSLHNYHKKNIPKFLGTLFAMMLLHMASLHEAGLIF